MSISPFATYVTCQNWLKSWEFIISAWFSVFSMVAKRDTVDQNEEI